MDDAEKTEIRGLLKKARTNQLLKNYRFFNPPGRTLRVVKLSKLIADLMATVAKAGPEATVVLQAHIKELERRKRYWTGPEPDRLWEESKVHAEAANSLVVELESLIPEDPPLPVEPDIE